MVGAAAAVLAAVAYLFPVGAASPHVLGLGANAPKDGGHQPTGCSSPPRPETSTSTAAAGAHTCAGCRRRADSSA